MSLPVKHGLIIAALAAAVSIGGCTQVRSHSGYVIDTALINSVQPGVDNRDSVRTVLGDPTFASEFDDSTWYYVSRDSQNLAFNKPKPTAQTTIRVHFDKNGTVTSIDKTGLELASNITPSHKTTPTLGRKVGFFQSIFSNIGTVAPGGMGAGGSPDNTGQ